MNNPLTRMNGIRLWTEQQIERLPPTLSNHWISLKPAWCDCCRQRPVFCHIARHSAQNISYQAEMIGYTNELWGSTKRRKPAVSTESAVSPASPSLKSSSPTNRLEATTSWKFRKTSQRPNPKRGGRQAKMQNSWVIENTDHAKCAILEYFDIFQIIWCFEHYLRYWG